MLKKLLLTFLLFHTATVGLNVAYAEEPVIHNDLPAETTESLTENSLETVAEETAVVEDQNQSTDNPSYQEEIPAENVDQDQSTDQKVTQGQDVKGDAEEEQDQTADIIVCQEQMVNASVSCEDKIENDSEELAEQKQTTTVETGQAQDVDSVGAVKAEQKQGTEIDSKQSQEVTTPEGDSVSHNQGTNAKTKQTQTVVTENPGDIIQGQQLEVVVSQAQELSEKQDKQKQETAIAADQTQVISTSGSSKMEQTQTAEVKANMVDALKNIVDVGIKVTSRNYLEVVKDTTSNVVKFIQEIFVNDELVDVIDESYTLDGNDTEVKMQRYEKQYDWGSLVVGNSASIIFSESLQKYTSTMSSFLSLVFGLERTNVPTPENPDPVDPTPENPENPTPENPDPENPQQPENPTPENPNPENPQQPENPTPENPNPENPQQPDENPVTPVDNNGGEKGNTTTPPQVLKPADPVKVQPIAATGDGNQIPDTATNSYNYLLAGLLLTAAGATIFFKRRRI
ncbi:LPXTG cell wall anchor domain-containing protein [Neobacillus sp. K501]